MNLVNNSDLQAGFTFYTDKHGYEYVLVVVKGTFTIGPDGTCTPSESPQPLVSADEYYGEPGLSSVRYETDFAPHKPRADVIVIGCAHAADGRSVEKIDVSLEVGPIHKTVRVFGPRAWRGALPWGAVSSSPEPFLTMPLVYERAFGGIDLSEDEGKQLAVELRNPVGVGIRARYRAAVEGTPLPNLESPAHPIRRVTDRPPTASFGFLGRNWQPRSTYAGTYNQDWLDNQYPFLPLDFDDRYFQGAPEDQLCDYFQGGEVITLRNMTPDRVLLARLPSVTVPIRLISTTREEDLDPALDTVVLEPEQRRLMMTWRALTRLKGKASLLRELRVGALSPGRQRALETGKRYIDWSGGRR